MSDHHSNGFDITIEGFIELCDSGAKTILLRTYTRTPKEGLLDLERFVDVHNRRMVFQNSES